MKKLITLTCTMLLMFVVSSNVSAQCYSCPGDVDGNNAVGINDLLSVISQLGYEGKSCADLNGSGNVNTMDMIIVLQFMGTTCEDLKDGGTKDKAFFQKPNSTDATSIENSEAFVRQRE